ncbi:conserved Plasmodium protein, unknown function [Plasmodium reichenowi]|uniref:Plasmepsin 8 n=1 Tax=Plasmodium reichenowi TaxID=5854 RepID=A0A060S0R7_PLARE|nr:hypothetical protein PRSY57_1464800 [Plasmodium reichenowi]KYN94306.1 hypothetical protein PRSY57_1464800 [Plasmodium reichenowi]CDO67120.1 conserved Plasmodium protein, unknown function [Plasmodium reichenowi]SOV83416.1 conserved Plasmodium protein, unknown function [Plasmodium reichenowi]
MIRKRKSKIGDNEQEDGKNEEGEEAMEGLFLYNKKDSAIKSIEEVYENEEKNQNNESSTNKGITGNYNMDKMEDRIYHENEEGSINNEYDDSVEARKLNTLQKLIMENNNTDEMKSKTIDELFDKYDKEIQSLIENFELLKFSQLFKNPFGPNISRDERIVRIFYYSGFSFLPYLGWVIASIYASFCKEKYKKNIVSIRIICSIQCALIGFIILLIIAIINWNNEQAMLCKYEGISFKKELIKDSKYNIVFFGPRSTDEWMGSVLAKISKDLNFNVYTISYPNLKNQIIKRKKNVFLKDAFSCARLKLSNVILFSFQIESALNFTIPFLEKNEILGFLSFSKKFPKSTPTIQVKEKGNIIYFAPVEKNLYDVYISLTLRLCQNKNRQKYNIMYIVHHSFDKYQIRCSKKLADDYSINVNNFNFNTIGDEEKGTKYIDADFNEVIDDFYQFLVFIRDIISQNNLEFYRKMLCNNIMCESKGAICAL